MNQNQDTQRVIDAVSTFILTMIEIINEKRLPEKASCLIEPMLTKKQLARHFGVTVRTVENWMRRGCVPYYKLGKFVFFRISDVHAHWDEWFKVKLRTFGRGALYRPKAGI